RQPDDAELLRVRQERRGRHPAEPVPGVHRLLQPVPRRPPPRLAPRTQRTLTAIRHSCRNRHDSAAFPRSGARERDATIRRLRPGSRIVKKLLLPLLLLPAFAHAQAPTPAAANAADARLQAIYQAEWEWRMQQAPGWSEDSDNSTRKPATTLSDVGAEAQSRRLAYLDGVLRQL